VRTSRLLAVLKIVSQVVAIRPACVGFEEVLQVAMTTTADRSCATGVANLLNRDGTASDSRSGLPVADRSAEAGN